VLLSKIGRSILVAVAGLVLMSAYIAYNTNAGDLPSARVSPNKSLPRLTWQRTEGVEIGSAADFTLASGRLYVLDERLRRVVVLKEGEAGIWKQTAVFGSPGVGPGSLADPTGITAVANGEIAVTERRAMIHYFSKEGVYLRSTQLRLPCAPSFSQLASFADSSLLLASNCLGRSGDTLYTVLSWSRNGTEFEELAREPRMAVDGSWGTIYMPSRSLTVGTHTVLFGVGISNCFSLVTQGKERPTITRRCGVTSPPLAASAPSGFDLRLQQDRQRGRSMGTAYDWPTPLPYFFDKVETARGIVLLRPYHADSLLLQLAQQSEQRMSNTAVDPIAVVSLHKFVGCTHEACLWFDNTEQGGRLALLPVSAIEALLPKSTTVDSMPMGPST
jgi:hypothetical protein